MNAPKRCAATAHDFEKFDDATIYCRRCGEQRVVDVAAVIAKLPAPITLPCPYPHWPDRPYWYYLPITTSRTTTADRLGPVTVWSTSG